MHQTVAMVKREHVLDVEQLLVSWCQNIFGLVKAYSSRVIIVLHDFPKNMN